MFQGYFLSLDIGQSNVPVGDEVSRQVEMLRIVGLMIDLKAVVILRIVRDEYLHIRDLESCLVPLVDAWVLDSITLVAQTNL